MERTLRTKYQNTHKYFKVKNLIKKEVLTHKKRGFIILGVNESNENQLYGIRHYCDTYLNILGYSYCNSTSEIFLKLTLTKNS